MSRFRKYCLAVVLALVVMLASVSVYAAGKARNVILFIGDGMGIAQRTLAYYYLGDHPIMNQMDIAGMYTTHMADGYITDSAAAATAMATGVKTYDGAIGVDMNKQPIQTILEAAAKAGKSTGLVATVRVSHATPGAFAAHNEHRDNYDAIMADILDTGVDVILGGGIQHCLPAELGGVRKDGRNLLEEFAAKGYTIISTPHELAAATEAPLLGLFTASDMTPEIDRDPAKEPSLADMTRKAISLLSKDPDGFFLMVEGSQIDYAGHDNDAVRNVHETLGLDEAVAVAMSFAAAHPDTLVVVAADHETGALSIGKDYRFDPVALRRVKASYKRIASMFNEDRSNAVEVMREYAGIDLTEDELTLIKEATDPVRAVTTVLNDRIGVLFGSGNHSGSMLPLSAHGADAELFAGFYDNTDIPKKIATAMGIEF